MIHCPKASANILAFAKLHAIKEMDYVKEENFFTVTDKKSKMEFKNGDAYFCRKFPLVANVNVLQSSKAQTN